MKKKGYVITGFIFLIFFSALVLTLYYTQLAVEKEMDIYHKINGDKLYYLAENIYVLYKEFGPNPSNCEPLMGNLTSIPEYENELGVKISYECYYDDVNLVNYYYANLTKDDQQITLYFLR